MSVRLAAALGALRGPSGVRPSRTSSAPPVALGGTAILLTALLQFLDSHQARWRMFAPPVPPCHQPLSNSVVHAAGWLGRPPCPWRHPAPPGTQSAGSLLASGPPPAHCVVGGPSKSLIF
ncbi:hypothetical protein NDU88_007358 [Pleurodeles waltl]|uniref:Uncharacterized protein n=1 Tax=Pleurodeles waltl TaxID=8319 RepID=A0AAV7VTB1_PLEWA|nr:hypothetical protein NDU88_007358 [Pleurodeles waltl]